MKKEIKLTLIIIGFCCLSSFGQVEKSQLLSFKTGFNRVGFYNKISFISEFNKHQLQAGIRHYTLDNFFEKNTIGVDFGYQYLIKGANDKFHFYPGVSTSFFRETKTQAVVYLSDFKLINGVGYNINSNWSLNYHLGLGILLFKANLIGSDETANIEYYNYEMSLGINYRFGRY